jgi:hypothetical protein
MTIRSSLQVIRVLKIQYQINDSNTKKKKTNYDM